MTNLIGCVLTKQLPFQTLLATYYCFIDSCLISQYFLYNVVRRRSDVVIEGIEPAIATPPSRMRFKFKPKAAVVLGMLVSGAAAQSEYDQDSKMQTIGLIAAWASSLLYFTSRLPQMYESVRVRNHISLTLDSYTNYTRKSTEGLSVLLFVAAFLGNLFYTLSLLVSPLAWPSEANSADEARAFLAGALPFLIGSTGTLCFDIAIVIQWAIYRPPRTPLFNYQFSFQRASGNDNKRDTTEATALLRQISQEYGTNQGYSESTQ